MEQSLWMLMERVIVTRDSVEIYVMTFALKENMEFLRIVMVTFFFNFLTVVGTISYSTSVSILSCWLTNYVIYLKRRQKFRKFIVFTQNGQV